MRTRTKERFVVAQPFTVGQDPAEFAADAGELRAAEEWMADNKLAREGGRRVSDWTWEVETEQPWQFSARIAELRERIGEPWEPETPDDLITAEAVDRIEQAGPLHYRIGKCWAVRA
jgi:hypothetical protein